MENTPGVGNKYCCGGKVAHWLLAALVTILFIALSAWLGLKARTVAKEYKYIGLPIERHTITVAGEGRVSVMPDIAKIEVGTVIEKTTVSAAQQENTRIMNALNEKLAGFGVDKTDAQTANYSISPVYDWNDGRQTLRGYQVSQNLRLKIRDMDKVGDILGAAGELGANQVGGIEFTVDDPDVVKQQARVKALQNAKAKARSLADIMGVKLIRVISFGENVYEPTYNRAYYAEKSMGIGGGAAPDIQPGSAEFVINADIVYEIE
jgi:hypothetical protein